MHGKSGIKKKPGIFMKKKKQKKDGAAMTSSDLKLTQKLAALFEARNIEDFIDVRRRPWRLIYFIIGISRGVGFLLGATVLGAILIAFAKHALHKLGGTQWLNENMSQIFLNISNSVKNTPPSN